MQVVSALWRREIIKFARDTNRVVGAVLQPLVVWLLLGYGFQDTFRVPTPNDIDVPYLEYLFPGILALVALFTSIFSTISIVEERRSGFLQAALAAPVSRSSLVLGATLGGATLSLGQGALFLALAPMTGLVPSFSGLLMTIVILALISLAFTALGVIIAWRTRTTRGFHAVMNLFLIPLWVLSGAFFPASGAPAFLQWIVRLNPVSYGIDALRTAMYWPGAPPVSTAPFGAALAITVLFAATIFGLAVRAVNRSVAAS